VVQRREGVRVHHPRHWGQGRVRALLGHRGQRVKVLGRGPARVVRDLAGPEGAAGGQRPGHLTRSFYACRATPRRSSPTAPKPAREPALPPVPGAVGAAGPSADGRRPGQSSRGRLRPHTRPARNGPAVGQAMLSSYMDSMTATMAARLCQPRAHQATETAVRLWCAAVEDSTGNKLRICKAGIRGSIPLVSTISTSGNAPRPS
jgi:hypothetical protein